MNQKGILIILLLIAAGVVILIPGERKKEKQKKKREEMIRAFPGMLIKLDLLIRSGLSTRQAWLRLTEEYENAKKTRPKLRLEVYEEMLITAAEIQNGVSEAQAYVNFGRRQEEESYVKLGNLLAENLRQGISGFDERLQHEITESLTRRKNEALKKGEEAGTRLTFPMMVMLIVIMAVIMVPALMNF